MAKLKQADITRVKAMGFLWNRGTESFSGRILTGNGVITAKQLAKAAECAEKYGNGKVTFTRRFPALLMKILKPYSSWLRKKVCFLAEPALKSAR